MFIQIGEIKIPVKSVHDEKVYHEQLQRPALKVRFDTPITQEQLTAMLNNDWELLDNTNKLLGVQSGYSTLVSHEAVFVQMDTTQKELVTLRTEKEGFLADFIPLLNVPDDGSNINIKYSPFFQEWVPKVWAANENCRYSDYPYQCISGHDSTPNPAWNPKDTPALFRPYHATVAEHALPWRAPAGAHDMYKKGEYMVYEDGLTYKALMDTTYTPIEYPQAWEVQVA